MTFFSSFSSSWRMASVRVVPIATAVAYSWRPDPTSPQNESHCRAAAPHEEERGPKETKPHTIIQKEEEPAAGMHADAVGDFHGLFPRRQLFVPAVEYPLWHAHWDQRQPRSTGHAEEDRRLHRQIRKHGITRHIILIRHGQYDETYKVLLYSIARFMHSLHERHQPLL